MNEALTAVKILAVIALLFAVGGLIKPTYPLVAVAVLLLSVAIFISVR